MPLFNTIWLLLVNLPMWIKRINSKYPCKKVTIENRKYETNKIIKEEKFYDCNPYIPQFQQCIRTRMTSKNLNIHIPS